HGTDVAAGAAQARGARQFGKAVEATKAWRDDRADGSRIDVAVGVAADAAVHGAGVQARPAADAAEDFGRLAGKHVRPAVVEEHDVQFLRPALVAGAARAANQRRVHGELLPGCRAR